MGKGCSLNVSRKEFIFVSFFSMREHWDNRPTITISSIKAPARFLRHFRCTTNVRSNANVVIFVLFAVFIYCLRTILRMIVIISRMCLRAYELSENGLSSRQIVNVIGSRIRTKRSCRLVRLISTFISVSPFKRGHSSFSTFFLGDLE